jgi:mannose-6-phosphate isomerase class I
MNIVKLRAGEWFLIPADVPHAYIQGELIECMINSDNVVRGGLTPKLKDADTLLRLLPYDDVRKREVWQGEEIYDGTEPGFSILRYLAEDFPELQVFRISMP